MFRFELNVEETKKYISLGILCYNEQGKKVYYGLETLDVEESQKLSTEKHKLTHKFIPLTDAELKSYGIEETQAQPLEEVDIEESAQSQTTEEPNKVTIKGSPEAVSAAKMMLLQAQMKQQNGNSNDPEKAELKEENEDLKNKLAFIAEKEFERKRKSVNAPDEINTPEKLMGFIEAQKQMNPKNDLAGVAPLNQFQMNGGRQEATDLAHQKFPNIETAIATLQAERRNGNAEAADLLEKLWTKGIRDWRVAGHPSQSFNIDDNVEKVSGVPDINFDNMKVSDISELSRFGIKKSPYNYSKTHNGAGQKKDD